MNKEIIYIEAKDDIANLISKIKSSTCKLIVLIPPKENNILCEGENLKKVAEVIRGLKKSLVVVTSDQKLINLSAQESIPVAANLKTAPSVPSVAEETPESVAESFVAEPEASGKLFESVESEEKDNEPEEDDEKPAKHPSFMRRNLGWFIGGGVFAILLGCFIFWALAVAPAANIKVTVKTSQSAFSENVTFTLKQEEEDSKIGKFYLSEEKYEKESKVEFEATGERDEGNKAIGTVEVSAYLQYGKKLDIPLNTTFVYNNLVFNVQSSAQLSFNSEKCENSDAESLTRYGCLVSTSVKIAANAPGTQYNLAPHNSGWTSSLSGLTAIKNSSAFSGGTTKMVKFVQQSDIDKAKEQLSSTGESTGRAKLAEQLSDSVIAIDSSFSMNISEPVSVPALNETVKDDVTPTLSSTATFRLYTIDAVRVEEFIKEKAKINNDRNIYSIGEPFIERFVVSDDSYSAKLKTTYQVGPNITEETIRNKIYGEKIGDAKSRLNSINGVKSEISTSFFWVNKIPSDPNKVTVEIIDMSSND